MIIQFAKMHGLGNDFVIIDSRNNEVKLTTEQIIDICDRKLGIGCDQLIMLKKAENAACEMVIFNSDGTQAGACGNATRCVAKLIDLNEGAVLVGGRLLKVSKDNDNYIVNMGEVTLDPKEIPTECPDPLNIDFINEPVFRKGYAAGIGNPHLVFFVDAFEGVNLVTDGQRFERHQYFPERTNVSFANIIDKSTISLQVWERGAGATLACGSAACVVGFIANRLNKVGKEITIKLPGGDLGVILSANSVNMSGPAELSFTGEIMI